MKHFFCLMLTLLMLLPCLAAAEETDRWYSDRGAYVNTYDHFQSATLKMRIATRSGPGTVYDELGSFLKTGENVTVISRGYDVSNEIWWVQVEFMQRDKLYRAYTGLKRVDVDIDTVQEEVPLGRIKVNVATIPYYGPGEGYVSFKKAIPAGWNGTVYAQEGDWLQIEFCLEENKSYRRVWLPQSSVTLTAVY